MASCSKDFLNLIDFYKNGTTYFRSDFGNSSLWYLYDYLANGTYNLEPINNHDVRQFIAYLEIDSTPEFRFSDWYNLVAKKEGVEPPFVFYNECMRELYNVIEFSGYDPVFQSVINYANSQGYTLPSTDELTRIAAFSQSLYDGGIFAKLDTFYLFAIIEADTDFAGIDWIRLNDASKVNSPVFTQNEGFSSDGATSYLNTNFNLANDSANYTQNEASFFVMTSKSDPVPEINNRLFGLITTPNFTTLRYDENASTSRNKVWMNSNLLQNFQYYKIDNSFQLYQIDLSGQILKSVNLSNLAFYDRTTTAASITTVPPISEDVTILRENSKYLSPLNIVGSFGMGAPFTSTEITTIENAYKTFRGL